MVQSRGMAVALFATLAALLAAGGGAAAQSDEFNTSNLSPAWFWVRPDVTAWSLQTRPGFLRINTQQGGIAGTIRYDARNLLLQGTQTGDWVVNTRVICTPTADYHQGGFIVYGGDDDYVKLVRSHVQKDGGQVIEMVSEVAGKMSFFSSRVESFDVYLRLTKTGTTYKGEFSTTGKPSQWFSAGSFTNAVPLPKVGLMAIDGGTKAASIPIDFDYFRGTGAGFGVIAPTLTGVPRVGTTVFVDLAAEPDAWYQLAASFGTRPGIDLGSRNIPLNPDALLVLTLSNQLPGVFQNLAGYLNARGEARAWMVIPNAAGLVGVSFYMAFVTLDAVQPQGINTISSATPVKIEA